MIVGGILDNKKIIEKELNNVRDLAEMYLCSSFLKNEIYNVIRLAGINERDISALLSQKTGKPLNSIYRDKNNLTVYSASSLLRYWKAMLDILAEKNISQFPNLNNVLSKYQVFFSFISEIADASDLNNAVEHHVDFIVDMLIYFEQNPLPPEKKKTKQPILDKIYDNHSIKERLNLKKQAVLMKRKKGMMEVD